MAMVRLVSDMEFFGIGFDPDMCQSYIDKILSVVRLLEEEAQRLVSRRFALDDRRTRLSTCSS